jgi:hypothetical protein
MRSLVVTPPIPIQVASAVVSPATPEAFGTVQDPEIAVNDPSLAMYPDQFVDV